MQQERPKTENAIVTGATFIRQLEREVIKMYNEGIEKVEELYEEVLNNWHMAHKETSELLLKTIKYERKDEVYAGFVTDLIYLDKKLNDIFNDYLKETILAKKELEFYKANEDTFIDKTIDYLFDVDNEIEKLLHIVHLNNEAIENLKQEGK